MPEYAIEFATRQIKRTFERAIGKSLPKILTELVTNADDSYRRLIEPGSDDIDPKRILVMFERSKRRFSVTDNAEGLTDEEMRHRFLYYGQESSDRSRGFRTRSLFGKGLRDVLFTQTHGQVKSIKDGKLYTCRFRWKSSGGQERPIIDIKPSARVTPELREALRIPNNGTRVEFVLRDDVRTPRLDRLVSSLSRFYMLRMINSRSAREVLLEQIDRRGQAHRHQLVYRFPEAEPQEGFSDHLETDIGSSIEIVGEISLAGEELTQGEVGYVDREGGLLVLDEDEAVLDLHLFGFDDDPAARRVCGIVRLNGAGAYIRAKLNQSDPEEILTETRDGFDKQHPFYRQLRAKINPQLAPVIERLRELGPTPKIKLSEKTRERHKQAFDVLNQLANELLGRTGRAPNVPSGKRVPPPDGIAFVNTHVSIQTGVVTPVALLVNPSVVSPGDSIDIVSELADIVVAPSVIVIADKESDGVAVVKLIRLTSAVAGASGRVIARWKNVQTAVDVTTTIRDIVTPIDGLEFERDEYTVRIGGTRTLRLYVDLDKVPVGAQITCTSDAEGVVVARESEMVTTASVITDRVAEISIQVSGNTLTSGVGMTAAYREFVAGTRVSVTRREKKEDGKHGLFRDYRFQPLERKVQTQFVQDGFILVNTKDPVNERYFGDDPGRALEKHAHCQVRLADLILNECLEIMVTQALEAGRLERRFPNNPEIDLRRYVDEKRYDIGPLVHAHFVTSV